MKVKEAFSDVPVIDLSVGAQDSVEEDAPVVEEVEEEVEEVEEDAPVPDPLEAETVKPRKQRGKKKAADSDDE